MASTIDSRTGLATQLAGTKSRADMSPVERLTADKAEQVDKTSTNFFKSEPYFKAKSMQLKSMMAFYANFGMTEEYNAVSNEATRVIKEYVKIYGMPKTADSSTTSTKA